MLLLRLFVISIFLIYSSLAYAEGEVLLNEDIDDDEQEFSVKQDEDNNKKDMVQGSGKLLSQISSAIGEFAEKNITDAEQVFCYQIATPPENYTGYTIDGMAIVGFCGFINAKLRNIIITQLLNNPEHIDFDKTEDCVVRPQVMLRFMRGIDATDILLSSPCHAVAVFYGGKVSAFNAKPGSTVIENLVRPLIKNKVSFVSPTLFNQLLPIGIAKTDAQKALLKQKNEPFRQWEQNKQEKSSKSSGWNKLKSK